MTQPYEHYVSVSTPTERHVWECRDVRVPIEQKVLFSMEEAINQARCDVIWALRDKGEM